MRKNKFRYHDTALTLAVFGMLNLFNNNIARGQEKIVQINSQYTPKYNTIAHQSMNILEEIENPYPSYKTLDSLIDVSKTYFSKKNYTNEEKEKIAQQIYEDINVAFPKIKERKDACWRSSLIYLAIAKENDIPFYLIEVPGTPAGHSFIRWDDKNDGHNSSNQKDSVNNGDVNIETNTGKIVDDENYFSQLMSQKSIENNFYMSNKNEDQVKAMAYWYKSLKNLENKNPYQGLKNSEKAIALDSLSIKALQTKADCYIQGKNYPKALNVLNNLIEMNPEPEFYAKKGLVFKEIGNYEKAIEEYTIAIDKIRELREKEKDISKIYSLLDSEITYLAGRCLAYKTINYEKYVNDINEAGDLIKLCNELKKE